MEIEQWPLPSQPEIHKADEGAPETSVAHTPLLCEPKSPQKADDCALKISPRGGNLLSEFRVQAIKIVFNTIPKKVRAVALPLRPQNPLTFRYSLNPAGIALPSVCFQICVETCRRNINSKILIC